MERINVNTAALEQMRNAATASDICMIITTDAEGKRHNRPMAAVKIDDDASCWFFASKRSGKLKDIAVNNKVEAVFSDPATGDYMEIHGTGLVVCDENEIMAKWSPLVSQWFPNGTKDPEVCLIRIKITSVFYWDENTEGIKRLAIGTVPEIGEKKLAA